jgi:LPXTG-motif cell wall-anchored protein
MVVSMASEASKIVSKETSTAVSTAFSDSVYTNSVYVHSVSKINSAIRSDSVENSKLNSGIESTYQSDLSNQISAAISNARSDSSITVESLSNFESQVASNSLAASNTTASYELSNENSRISAASKESQASMSSSLVSAIESQSKEQDSVSKAQSQQVSLANSSASKSMDDSIADSVASEKTPVVDSSSNFSEVPVVSGDGSLKLVMTPGLSLAQSNLNEISSQVDQVTSQVASKYENNASTSKTNAFDSNGLKIDSNKLKHPEVGNTSELAAARSTYEDVIENLSNLRSQAAHSNVENVADHDFGVSHAQSQLDSLNSLAASVEHDSLPKTGNADESSLNVGGFMLGLLGLLGVSAKKGRH